MFDSPASAEWPSVPGYEFKGELGRGGMGVVYKARQIRLQRTVAVKMLLSGVGGEAELARFRAEAEAVARLQHPNVVQVYESGEWVRELARAVDAVHQREVLDRDLKPSNVLLAADGTLKISVYGLAKRVAAPDDTAGPPVATPTQTGAVLGTPAYMAPELAAGAVREVGPAAAPTPSGPSCTTC